MVTGTRGQSKGGHKKGDRKKGSHVIKQNITTNLTSNIHSPTPSPNTWLPIPDLSSLPFLDPCAPLEVTSIPLISSPLVAKTRGQRSSKDRGGLRGGGSGRSRQLPPPPQPPSPPPPRVVDSRVPLEASFIASHKAARTRGQRSSKDRGGRRGGGLGRSRQSPPPPLPPPRVVDSRETPEAPFIASHEAARTRGRGSRGRGGGRGAAFAGDVVARRLPPPPPPPELSSPSHDSLSPTHNSEEYEGSYEGGASFTRDSSEDEESFVEERGDDYISRNIITNVVEKKVIHIVGLNYMEQEVVRTITKDFKKHFYGKETQWHLLDRAFVEHLYKIFQERHEYDTEVDPEHARKVWEERSKVRCRGTWSSVRRACIKKTGSTNPSDWKHFRPIFVKNQKDWEQILESWSTEKWQRQSISGAKNRQRVPGEEGGDCAYVRHTGGSVNFGIHCKRLEIELGKKPTQIELFGRLHKREKGKGEWCDARAEKVAEKYQEKIRQKRAFGSKSYNNNSNEQSSEAPFDPEAWVEAIGGPKKTHVYGLGEEAHNVFNKTLASYGNKRSRNFTPEELENHIQEQVDARLDARMEELKAEMNEQMQLQIQQMLASFRVPSLPSGRSKGRR